MADVEVDIGQLTEDQQLALQQFTSVTDQDLNAAVPLLQKCEWNVQIAIARFFDGEPAEPAVEADPDIPPPRSSRRQENLMTSDLSELRSYSRRSNHNLSPAPRIVNQPESQVVQQPAFPFSLFLAPINIIWSMFSKFFNILSYVFPFLPRLIARFTARLPTSSQRRAGDRRPLGTRDTAARFLREFEEEYGSHRLPFLEQGYAQAFDLAKRDLKFLLVVPLSPEHDDTADFVRLVLLAPSVVDFLNDPTNNVLLWAGTVQDSEAYQVGTALNITKFPAAGLIVHTPNVSATSMSVIARIAGPTSPEEFLAKLKAAITQHSGALEEARGRLAEQRASRNLREQQNSAYERSLAQDRERARKKKEEAARKEKEAREAREKEEAKEKYESNLLQWKRWRAQSIANEPGANVKDVVRISLRLASGERVMRRFTAEAHIEEVYALVECHEILESGEALSEKEIKEPAGFEHKYKFRLVSPMPREAYELEAGGTVGERIGRSGNLIVEKIEEDAEDEEAIEDS